MRWISCDERTVEFQVWSKWFGRVPRIRAAFADYVDDDPLQYNETASVGIFASAASRVGLIAMAEYVSKKGDATDLRKPRNGRGDLWVLSPESNRSWAFEFKQMWARHACREATIEAQLIRAVNDAKAVRTFEADARYGALLIVPFECEKLSAKSISAIERIAADSTAAVRFGGGTPVYLLIRRT